MTNETQKGLIEIEKNIANGPFKLSTWLFLQKRSEFISKRNIFYLLLPLD